MYNERPGGGVVALPLISSLADEGDADIVHAMTQRLQFFKAFLFAGLSAGSVLVFENPPSAFPAYARNVLQVSCIAAPSEHLMKLFCALLPNCCNPVDPRQYVDVRVKSATAARASDNPLVLGFKVLLLLLLLA